MSNTVAYYCSAILLLHLIEYHCLTIFPSSTDNEIQDAQQHVIVFNSSSNLNTKFSSTDTPLVKPAEIQINVDPNSVSSSLKDVHAAISRKGSVDPDSTFCKFPVSNRVNPKLFAPEFLKKVDLFPNQANTFGGGTLRMAGPEYPGYVETKLVKGKRVLTYGMVVLYISIAQKHFHFKYEFELMSSGIRLPNGSFTGTLAAMSEERFDIVVVCVQTSDTKTAVDALNTVMYDFKIGFITSLPRPLVSWMTPFLTFAPDTWILVAISLILAALFLIFASWLQSRLDSSPKVSNSYVWLDAIIFPYKTLLWQTAKLPKISWIRPFALCWFFFGLIMIVSFDSRLKTRLTTPLFEPEINNLQDLLKASNERNFKIGYLSVNTVAFTLFSQSQHGIFKQINQRMKIYGVFEHLQCYELAVKEKNACIGITAIAEYLINAKYMDDSGAPLVHVAEEAYFRLLIVTGLLKGSPFSVTFDKLYLRIFESGIANRFLSIHKFREITKTLRLGRKKKGSSGVKQGNERNLVSPLTLSQLGGPFLILLVLLGGSFITFVLEKIFWILHH